MRISYVQGADMPRKGFKTITVTEKKHHEAKTKAAKHGLSLQDYIENLIEHNAVDNAQLSVLEEVPVLE